MSFIGNILHKLVNDFKTNPNLENILNPLALLTVDRRGNVKAQMRESPSHQFPPTYPRPDYTGSQLRKFNGYNYKVADLIEFVHSPEKLVAHLIAVSLKERATTHLKFAAIDLSGKIYAYSNHPTFNEDSGRWDGNVRKFICRLERAEYMSITQPKLRVFNLDGWNVSYCKPINIYKVVPKEQIDPKPPEYLASGLCADIKAHIEARVNRIEEDHQMIGELTDKIAKMREEIQRANNRIATNSGELTTLISAAKLMGVANG